MATLFPKDTLSTEEARVSSTGFDFPTSEYFANLVKQGQLAVKDLADGRMRCISLISNGNHCGRYLISQEDASGNRKMRCPVKHDPKPEKNEGDPTPRILTVAERQKFEKAAKIALDPEKGVPLDTTKKLDEKPEEKSVEIIAKDGDRINFDITLDELSSPKLVNQLLEKISSALEDVPTPTLKVAKRLMKIQESIEALKK
jgi:hypothetical protein